MLAYRMVDVFLLKEGSMNNLFHIMALVRDRPLFKLVVVGKLISLNLFFNVKNSVAALCTYKPRSSFGWCRIIVSLIPV